MNANCLKCNLKTLNQYKEFAEGNYAKQFEIESHSSNVNFVSNPYIPCKCHNSDVVCFSLTDGAGKCRPNTDKMLGYNVNGKVTVTKVRFD